MGRKSALKGYKIKNGRVEKDLSRLNVSARLKYKSSKKVRVGKRSG